MMPRRPYLVVDADGVIRGRYAEKGEASRALRAWDRGFIVLDGKILEWGKVSGRDRALQKRLQSITESIDASAEATGESAPVEAASPVETPAPTEAPAPPVTASEPVTTTAPVATAAPAPTAASSDPLFVALMAKYTTRHHASLALKSKNIVYSWRDNRVPEARRAQVEALLAGKPIEPRRPRKAPSAAHASKRAQQPKPPPRVSTDASPPAVAASTPAPDAVTIPRAEWQRITERLAELEAKASEWNKQVVTDLRAEVQRRLAIQRSGVVEPPAHKIPVHVELTVSVKVLA